METGSDGDTASFGAGQQDRRAERFGGIDRLQIGGEGFVKGERAAGQRHNVSIKQRLEVETEANGHGDSSEVW